MIGTHAIHNGTRIPLEKATISVGSLPWTYGFGVYETLRVRKQTPFFVEDHLDRLFTSADTIHLAHPFTKDQYTKWISTLLEDTQIDAANIKILLIGGQTAKDAQTYLFLLAPKYVEKKDYSNGVHVISHTYERFAPQAKTLNMLPSYVLYTNAQAQNAYECLLLNRNGEITEGTKSNVFAIRQNTLISPPEKEILLGITRKHVIACAKKEGFTVVEEPIRRELLSTYDGLFLTNTSHRIVPIASVDSDHFSSIAPSIHRLRIALKQFEKELISS